MTTRSRAGEGAGAEGREAPEPGAPRVEPRAADVAEPHASLEAAPPGLSEPTRSRRGSHGGTAIAEARDEDVPAASPESAAALAAEVDLITRAKRSLPGDPARSLQLLAHHAERFADGQLATERAGYRALALCALGRRAEGRAEARAFVAAHGGGSLARRVERECEISEPAP